MIKSFALIDNIWFAPEVKFPLKIGEKYILRKLYDGKFKYQKLLKEWELSNNHATGRYPYVIEVRREYERKDYHAIFFSIRNLITLLRLIKYNRVYFAYIVCFENKRLIQSGSSDDPRPSSAVGQNEELSRRDIKTVEKIVENIKQVIDKNERAVRALHFWDTSSCSGSFERKVVELFTSLESLFTTGKEEVTFRLATIMAWFLENKDANKRLELYKKIKSGYKIRSKIVHGQALVENQDLPIVQELHSYTRDILLKILEDKKLLSIFSQNDIEVYFSEIVMGKFK